MKMMEILWRRFGETIVVSFLLSLFPAAALAFVSIAHAVFFVVGFVLYQTTMDLLRHGWRE